MGKKGFLPLFSTSKTTYTNKKTVKNSCKISCKDK